VLKWIDHLVANSIRFSVTAISSELFPGQVARNLSEFIPDGRSIANAEPAQERPLGVKERCSMTAETPSELSYNPHIPLSQALLLPRIAIENTQPTLDGGQFAVKSIAGREIVVTSKVFADGHDKLAVRIRWREEGEETWQSEVMSDQGNNGWQGQFRPEHQGRFLYCIEAWIDHFASFQ
jgi:hypothetical protein